MVKLMALFDGILAPDFVYSSVFGRKRRGLRDDYTGVKNPKSAPVKGGFIHRRHDELRDIFAKLLEEVAYDVRVEPPLTFLTGEKLPSSSNVSDDARLDVAARGFWQRCEMEFFDVRVFNPYAKTHLNQSLNAAFTSNQGETKRQCNQRCIQIEHASFTPLISSAYGGCSCETYHFMHTLSDRLAEKKCVIPEVAMNSIRTKLCFAQMRALIDSLCLWFPSSMA